MSSFFGFSMAHQRSSEQQQEIREARRIFKERIRNDWDYPPLPQFQLPISKQASRNDEVDEGETTAGFKFHHAVSGHDREVLVNRGPEDLDFDPIEWRERDYSSEESSDEDSWATSSSHGSKKSTYKFEDPDSVGAHMSRRKLARKRKRQKDLDEEVTWNHGLAHWMARRDVWCGAHTSTQIEALESRRDALAHSTSISVSSTPRTSVSSTSDTRSEPTYTSTPSTTPDLASEPATIDTRPPAPPTDILVPLAPTILANHPVRRRITPELYPEIYNKIILQSRTPSVPINLLTLTRALVQGWKDDGEWPPKQTPVEKSIGRKKNGGESSLRSGVRAVGRVLRITSGESSVGGRHSGS